MPRRLTNDLLLALVLAQVLGGLLGWAWPVASAAPLYAVHRGLGVALIVVLGWKQSIALASLRRRLRRRRAGWDRSVVWGITAGLGLVVCVGIGLAWTLNVISFDLLWGYSPMNVHVAAGLLVVPFAGAHLLVRRRQNAASLPLASRRTALRLAGLGLASLIGWQAVERLAPAVRLGTGSKPTASLSGNAFPAEIWLLDGVPSIDVAGWRLHVASRQFSLAELVDGLPARQVQAVLDCTSGWWSEQVWSGVGVLDVLRLAGAGEAASQVVFESLTGHRIELPLADLDQALLATHVGGEPLSPGHGFPVRLVVPGRRGYQWVKWLARVDVRA